ncbi:MAG TPA: zinc ABC transporter substrate-binding protein [Burkholderiaceae bacterium]|nr:zinc ABC transporter substrate-binding protein [Burkholderiaceae bacterium]HNB44749.1 zinc ABC transporter substrate-binding protein [Burkholderiaceae bacterium]HNG79176.1 zinc ABC transporter substrate-binding protein [Burkholderiaceae bacterium]
MINPPVIRRGFRRGLRHLGAALIAWAALAPLAGAQAALRVVACEPEWAALTEELAGPLAQVYTATTAQQDPHQVQARPSLLAAVRRADLLVCTGAELEIGWLPLLQRQAANPAIQAGQPGHFEAAAQVSLLEAPTRLDRADGDVHAAGNPHIQTDPRRIAQVAMALSKRLAELDAAHAADYARRHADFAQRWQAALTRWERSAAPLKGLPIVVQHKGFPYLEQWLGLKEVAALEPKPGVEPSSAHLQAVLTTLQRQPARAILRAAYNDGRGAEWLAERTKLPVVVLPYTVGGSDAAKDLFGLFDDTLARLLKAVQP